MAQEVKPEFKQNGQYNNLDTRQVFKQDGDFTFLEKVGFAEGYKNTATTKDGRSYEFYNCKIQNPEGIEGSMVLYENDHERWAALDANAKFKMTFHKSIETNEKTGKDFVKKYYTFEEVQ